MGLFRREGRPSSATTPSSGPGTASRDTTRATGPSQSSEAAEPQDLLLGQEAAKAYVEGLSEGDETERSEFAERFQGLSKRDQKKLRKQIDRELSAQLKDAKRRGRTKASEQDKADRLRAADIYKERKARSKQVAERTREQRRKRDIADNVLDAIGYDLMFENGICEVEEGLFSETLSFDDITYQNAREEDQRGILKFVCDILNYFNSETSVQFQVINTPLRPDEVENRQFYDVDAQPNERCRKDAEIMNGILSDKLKQGVSNIRRERLLTITVQARDADEAYRRLSRINTDLSTSFESIKCATRVLNGTERLERMLGVLRPGRQLDFDYERDLSVASPLTTKDFIAPMSMDFAPDGEDALYKSDDVWCQVLVMRQYDSPLDDTVVAKLVDLPIPINVTWHVQPMDKAAAVNFVKVRGAWIDKEIIEEQRKAVAQGYDYSILPSETKSSKEETEDLLRQLQGQSQHLFLFSGLIWTYAKDLKTLTEQCMQIMDTARASGITVEMLEYRQRQGMNSVLPVGLNHVDIQRPFTTAETCIFAPFATLELDDRGGNWYYQNKLSNNLVLGNRARLSSPVGFVSGKTGSGKSFFVKNEIEGTILSKPTDQVIFFDRAGEYLWLTEHHDGTCATFGVDSDTHLNPLAMVGLEDQSEESQVAFKTDAILAQAGASAEEAGMPLSDEERSIIQRCVESVFAKCKRASAERGTKVEPLLGDLYNELMLQPERQARSIALRYERYVTGPMSFFNAPNNVDFSSRVVDLNLKEIPESMLVFALVTLCEAARYQMYQNHARGIRTWLYIEEMESLFKYPTVLNYFRRLSNECRKFGMYLTGITQSAESMIRNPDANSIVKNADFIMLLRQSKEDRDYWASALGLSPLEIGCIDESTPRGNGLLCFGESRIPIKGEFPKGNELYDLFSTDPNEAAERRARRAKLEAERAQAAQRA